MTNQHRNIVILTGAGISAESGIDTFRAAGGQNGQGLWEQHRVENVATPEGFVRDPDLVLGFYDQRRAALARAEPNAAHAALARLEREFSGKLLLVTQNVDDLHERGGSAQVLHMHGELNSALCTSCETRSRWEGAMLAKHGERPPCPVCCAPMLRPDVVWFGEMPYQMGRIYQALETCDLFVSIGTSGAVYPAAGFVQEARSSGAHTLELNLEPSDGSRLFHEARLGPASRLVPAWVDAVLGG